LQGEYSSFIKRRLGTAPISMTPSQLDQVPESLFPALMLMQAFNPICKQ
jgi:hypothetical protein